MKFSPGNKPAFFPWGVVFALFLPLLTGLAGCSTKDRTDWLNPYAEVNWESAIRAKGQFHTHSLISGSGRHFAPHEVVDLYHELEYDILAITDRWKVTWPWDEFSSLGYEDRDPRNLGMLAVPGSEPQFGGHRQHHLVSLFSKVDGRDMTFEQTLMATAEAGGLVALAHPGRSAEYENNTLEDYIRILDTYPHVFGFELFTSYTFTKNPERWPRSKERYAQILRHYGSPGTEGWRPLWLTSTDDFSRIPEKHTDTGFHIHLLEKLDHPQVYNSLKNGTFFWVVQAHGEKPPVIESIEVDGSKISVKGKGYDRISWYSDHEIIHEGEYFDFYENGREDLLYVYFVAQTDDFNIGEPSGSLLGSQPFWVIRTP